MSKKGRAEIAALAAVAGMAALLGGMRSRDEDGAAQIGSREAPVSPLRVLGVRLGKGSRITLFDGFAGGLDDVGRDKKPRRSKAQAEKARAKLWRRKR